MLMQCVSVGGGSVLVPLVDLSVVISALNSDNVLTASILIPKLGHHLLLNKYPHVKFL